MPEEPKPKNVTMRGGLNIAPTETKKPRGRPPGSTKPENQKTEPPKSPEEPTE